MCTFSGAKQNYCLCVLVRKVVCSAETDWRKVETFMQFKAPTDAACQRSCQSTQTHFFSCSTNVCLAKTSVCDHSERTFSAPANVWWSRFSFSIMYSNIQAT